MSDKDLLVVISEMLRKQDQQAEKLDEHSVILNRHTAILDHHTGLITETNETLKRFVDISIQQFEQLNHQYEHQQLHNERFLNSLNQLNERFSSGLNQLNESFSNNQDQQNQFNERLLNKLGDIENALKK